MTDAAGIERVLSDWFRKVENPQVIQILALPSLPALFQELTLSSELDSSFEKYTDAELLEIERRGLALQAEKEERRAALQREKDELRATAR